MCTDDTTMREHAERWTVENGGTIPPFDTPVSYLIKGKSMYTKEGFYLAHGYYPDQVFICIPHEGDPFVDNDVQSPPITTDGDSKIKGDHDYHATISISQANMWNGHQKYKVQFLAHAIMVEAKECSE